MSTEHRGVREILAGIEATMKAEKEAHDLFRLELGKRLDNHGVRLNTLEHISMAGTLCSTNMQAHSSRISSLEKWRWILTGGWTGAVMAIGGIIKFLVK